MKKCSKCKETKPLTSFHSDTSRKDGLSYYCMKCKQAIKQANKEAAKQLRASRQAFVRRYQEYRGCDTCGFKGHHSQFQWSHIVPRCDDPDARVVSEIMSCSIKRIFKEIRKCRNECANCHAKSTWEEGLSSRGTGRPMKEFE